MITENGQLKCDDCGKFISHNDAKAITYTPYGSTSDSEPPDPLEICGRCVHKIHNCVYRPESVWKIAHPLFVLQDDGSRICTYIHQPNAPRQLSQDKLGAIVGNSNQEGIK